MAKEDKTVLPNSSIVMVVEQKGVEQRLSDTTRRLVADLGRLPHASIEVIIVGSARRRPVTPTPTIAEPAPAIGMGEPTAPVVAAPVATRRATRKTARKPKPASPRTERAYSVAAEMFRDLIANRGDMTDEDIRTRVEEAFGKKFPKSAVEYYTADLERRRKKETT
jgi:hypothetical protein